MKPRSFAALGLLLLCSATWAQAPASKAWKPAAKPAPARTAPTVKPPPMIDGVRDTGQYLPDSAVIGRVDQRRFTVGEFRERWFASYLLDRPRTDSAGRYQFLTSMVNKEVLAALARQVNRPLGFEDRAVLRETRQRLLSNATFARLVADSARYTNDEVRHLYEQGNVQLHLQRLLTNDPGVAERARAEVAASRIDWADAVKQYSIPQNGLGADGDMGWVKRSALGAVPALEVFDLPDGGLSRVFRSDEGWWFVRVVERRPDRQPLLQHIAKALAQEVLSVKVARRSEQVRDLIRRRIGMAYDSTNIAWAASMFAGLDREIQGSDNTPVIDVSGAVPEFQPADTARLLARWKDGRMTLGGFLAIYNTQDVIQREKVTSFSAFRSNIDRFVLEPYMADLAVEMGFERDSIVVAGMDKKEEQIRVEHLFGDSIETKLWVSPQERQAYYDEHLADFFGLQSVTYAAFGLHGRAAADSLVARLKAGERAEDVLRADSLAGIRRGSIKTEGERDGSDFHKLLFEELREGGTSVLGPDKLGDYLVLQKLVHDPGHQLSLKEVESLVDESCQNLKADRLLKELIERHRSKHDIEMHPELLPRIRLLDPRN